MRGPQKPVGNSPWAFDSPLLHHLAGAGLMTNEQKQLIERTSEVVDGLALVGFACLIAFCVFKVGRSPSSFPTSE